MSAAVDRYQGEARRPAARLAVLLLIVASGLASSGFLGAQEQPVGSFDAIVADDQANAEAPAAPEPKLSFSFRFAPWEEVLTKFADVAGLTLDLTDVPNGTFNYYDNGRYSPREALDILNGYLLQRGFVLVRRDRFLVCVNLEKGLPANLIPLVSAEQLPDLGDNELATVILSGEGVDASLAAGQIAPLQGSHGKTVVMSATNSLLVTDTGGNLRLFQRLLDGGAFQRRASGGSGTAFKSFELQHVRADEAERMVRTLFGLPAAMPSDSASPVPTAGLADLKITADLRTNRLFVTGTSAQLASIEQIVEAYDVDQAAAEGAPRRRSTTTRILPLSNADVILIGRALEALSPRIRVSTTRSTNANANATTGQATNESNGGPAGDERPAAATPSLPAGRDR